MENGDIGLPKNRVFQGPVWSKTRNPGPDPGSEAASAAAAAAEVEEEAAAFGAGEVLLGDHEVHEAGLAACSNQHLRVRRCDFRRVSGWGRGWVAGAELAEVVVPAVFVRAVVIVVWAVIGGRGVVDVGGDNG